MKQAPNPLPHRVFTQVLDLGIDTAALERQAGTHFRLSLDVLDHPPNGTVRLRVESQKTDGGTFSIRPRFCTPADLEDAVLAEERGRASGMSLLAQKCPSIWEVHAEPDVDEAALLELCGVLASVALGPVMPPDISTLFGVRGAMERVEKLLTRRAQL